MGIKGLYGYCNRNITESYKTVNILEEIANYQSEHQKPPLLIINLSTLSYHFKLKIKDLLCGYQLNKIRFELELFLTQLKNAGCELEFVFKKTVADEKEFLSRRLRDYRMGCAIIDTIEGQPSFKNLLTMFNSKEERFPYNSLIQVALIQSAEKFGTVHGCNTLKGKPTIQHIDLAKKKDAAWLMGLDTNYFIIPGKWKIWCDAELDMTEMTVQEFDTNVVLAHLDLKPELGPLFACLAGDLQSNFRVTSKISQRFGKPLFVNVADFTRRIRATSTDDMIEETVNKIFGAKADPAINQDLKNSLKSFEINEDVVTKVDMDLLEMVKDDFMSIAEELLLNMPIFIFPAYLDMRKTDMSASFNDLVLPIIQKTAGILLKSINDSAPRKLILLKGHGEQFSTVPFEALKPDFEVPPVKTILSGEMPTSKKIDYINWITGMEFQGFELIPQEYMVDIMILLYGLKHKAFKLIDARCILKTLVDANRRTIPLNYSTEYPETINERAFRCSFLYSKLYFFFHSCFTALGMKQFCPDIQFDGVYFQKIYALNVLEDEEGKNVNKADGTSDDDDDSLSDEVNDDDLDEAEIIEEFSSIIRM